MLGQAQSKKKALEAAESLLRYSDSKVKTTAQIVADYLRGLPVGVDEFFQAGVPEGSTIARIEFRLGGVLSGGVLYEFRRPIKVAVVQEQGYFLATSNRFLIHGTGDTIEDALRDYMKEWHQHYRWLLSEAERLSPPLQKELVRIRRLLARERSAA